MDKREKDALERRESWFRNELWKKRHKENKTEKEIEEITGLYGELCTAHGDLGEYGHVAEDLESVRRWFEEIGDYKHAERLTQEYIDNQIRFYKRRNGEY